MHSTVYSHFFQLVTAYVSTNDLLSKYQSGFRIGHSIETLLLRLLFDCLNGGLVPLLALFDVSAVYTVNHEILIKRLSVSFGLSGLLLDWITYLARLSSCVVLGLGTSRSHCQLYADDTKA